MKHLAVLVSMLLVTACGNTGDAPASGGGSSARSAAPTAVVATTYTFELSGAGVTFSSDIHAYAATAFGGSQVETDLVTVLLGAPTNSYTVTGESVIANFTLNTGAGTLTIVTKKNGAILRTDTITTNATAISVSN